MLTLDEGHAVKNEDTRRSQALTRLHRQFTLLLTGTPLQNNLHELYALLNFMYRDIFTTSEPFDNAFDIARNQARARDRIEIPNPALLRCHRLQPTGWPIDSPWWCRCRWMMQPLRRRTTCCGHCCFAAPRKTSTS